MNIQVKLFAAARQIAGKDLMELQLPKGASVLDLRNAMIQQIPSLEPLLARALFAIDADYAHNETTIPEGAEVACIPPVSGG